MKQLFVDTSGWLAIVVKSDALHKKAADVYLEHFAAQWDFVTHTGVMLEVGNRLSSVRLRQLAVNLNKALESSSRIMVVQMADDIYEDGWDLYAARSDKEWGIVDCISFVLMKRQNIREALTADKQFEQAGFLNLL